MLYRSSLYRVAILRLVNIDRSLRLVFNLATNDSRLASPYSERPNVLDFVVVASILHGDRPLIQVIWKLWYAPMMLNLRRVFVLTTCWPDVPDA